MLILYRRRRNFYSPSHKILCHCKSKKRLFKAKNLYETTPIWNWWTVKSMFRRQIRSYGRSRLLSLSIITIHFVKLKIHNELLIPPIRGPRYTITIEHYLFRQAAAGSFGKVSGGNKEPVYHHFIVIFYMYLEFSYFCRIWPKNSNRNKFYAPQKYPRIRLDEVLPTHISATEMLHFLFHSRYSHLGNVKLPI